MKYLYQGKYLAVSEQDHGLEARLDVSSLNSPIYKKRLVTARRRFKVAIRKLGFAQSDEGRFLLEWKPGRTEQQALLSQLAALENRLSGILQTPLSPAAVEAYLAITTNERVLWTKQERLVPSERRKIIQGKSSFSLPYFSAEQISQLMENPKIIERWRSEQDD